jgi:RNA polymerase sigma-70 factor (ECF subfamily)
MEQEATLVEKLAQGDEHAFKSIYEEYHSQLYFFALRFLKSRQLSEEIVHDVFLKLWETKHLLNTSLSFKSYLYTITKNLVLNVISRADKELKIKNEIISYSPSSHNIVEDDITYHEYEAIAHAAISRLPAQRQVVFRMCRLEGLTYEEVAEKLGISKGTVSDHMVKAVRSIKQFIMVHADITLIILVFYL